MTDKDNQLMTFDEDHSSKGHALSGALNLDNNEVSDLDYHALNAMLNMYGADGKLQLEKDQEAVRQYFLQHVNQNTVFFHSLKEKLSFLVKNQYYNSAILGKYSYNFVKELFKQAYNYKFRFPTFMGAFKYYTSYTLKTFDGKRYLERYEDRVCMTALELANGNEQEARELVEEIISGRFQPATPTFLNCGKKQRGELVSCFPAGTLIDTIKGQISIEKLKVGDFVLTEDGQYREIEKTNVRKFEDKLLSLKVVGTPTIRVTPEHPFLVYADKNDTRESVHESPSTMMKWIAAKDIRPLKDHVVMAKPSFTREAKTYNLMDYINKNNNKNGRQKEGFVVIDGKIKYKNQDKKLKNKHEYSQSFQEINATVTENNAFGRFLGYYLSEGYIAKRDNKFSAVIFTLGKNELDFISDLENIGLELFGIKPTKNSSTKDGSIKINFNNSILAEFIYNLAGTGFGTKMLTKDLETAPDTFIEGILIAAFRGDGCCSSTGLTMSLVNPSLIHQLKLVATKIGLAPNVRYHLNSKENLTGTLSITGGTDNNNHFIHSVNKNLHKFEGSGPVGIHKHSFHEHIDGYTLSLVQSLVEEEYDFNDDVYNIQVKDNPTYSVNGIVVHNCFLVRVEDNMESIGRCIQSSLQLSKRGGGVALLLSNLREQGAPIKKMKGQSSGVVPVMKLLEDSFSYANQLGQRQGAGAVYLNAHHPDIMLFLDTKRENADEKIRIKTLSLGVVIPDITFELAKKNEDMYLFSPYDVERVYGVPFSDISVSEKYYEMVGDARISKKKINARELFQTLAELQFESGYPYVMFEDTVNEANPIKGKINMSNLCSEILQVNTPSEFNEDGSYKVIGKDISCNLGSMNVAKSMEGGNLAKTVEVAIRGLTAVSDASNIQSVPSIADGNRKSHAIGLGQMNLHGFFAKERMHYGSPESLDFTNMYFYTVLYHALRVSNLIAQERKETFVGFEDSKYATGEFFDKYLNNTWEPKTEKVREIFNSYGIKIPTKKDWEELSELIMEHGIYNQNLQAIPPTGSISYINHSTSSIHPIVAKIEIRKEGKIGRVYYPAPYMTNDNLEYYRDAYEIGYQSIIDVYAEATQHVDQGLSLTLYFPDTATTRDLNKAQIYAWKKGIKTIYYVRLRQAALEGTEIEGCVSCSL